jgi:uncharacterized YigZ family protein
MNELSDEYLEPKSNSESLFKEKGSKHFGFVFPVHSKAEIENILLELRKKHHTARHVCYAWTLGTDQIECKYSDDGEPHNSAGPPIMGQINSFQLHNCLVAVVRYFGGTKLGVGGLINAYKTAAREAIENGEIITKFKTKSIKIRFPYEIMDEVMRIAKQEGIHITQQEFQEDCFLELEVRLKLYSNVFENLSKLHQLIFE